MRLLGKVFSFELFSSLRKKSFLGSTLFILLLIFALTFVSRFTNLSATGFSFIEKEAQMDLDSLDFRDTYLVIKDRKIDEEYLLSLMNLNDDHLVRNEENLLEKVEDGVAERGIVVENNGHFKVYVKDKKYLTNNTEDFKGILGKYIFDDNLMKTGINPAIVEKAGRENIQSEEIVLGKDLSQSFTLSIFFMVILFLLVLFYGSRIANSMAREKNDRTMELLLTSSKAHRIVLGKVFSNGLLGIIQFFLFILAGVLGIVINRKYIPEEFFDYLRSFLNVEFSLYFIGFVLLGYLLYLFFFAMVGGRAERLEDVTSLALPVVFMMIISIILIIQGIAQPEGILLKALSFIPISSSMAMPVRYSLVTVTQQELLISLGIHLAFILLIAVFAVVSYRRGMSRYGNYY